MTEERKDFDEREISEKDLDEVAGGAMVVKNNGKDEGDVHALGSESAMGLNSALGSGILCDKK
ncbi:MAG: hypothetical protein IJ125_08935 [Atopobiaceae bacterium]|nr:hypothetical protein [Atopobiaceae bacterium]